MEAHLKKAYAAEAQVIRLANTARLLMVYLDGILQSATLPEPVASELSLVSGMLLQISGFKGKALGRNLAGLIVAYIRASSGSDPATVPPRTGGILTDGLDAPFPCSSWHPPMTWMVTWMVTWTNSGKRYEELPNPADYVSYHRACLEPQPPPAYPPISLLPQNPYTRHPPNSPVYRYPPPGSRAPYICPKDQYV
ncbi:UNVERIFIED_CONTAM: hypothetical protein FKN15_005438 [Acipenser sinensis]